MKIYLRLLLIAKVNEEVGTKRCLDLILRRAS